jgi:hypothetical protein
MLPCEWSGEEEGSIAGEKRAEAGAEMKRLSLRERARAAARELDSAGAGFGYGELSDFLEVMTRQEEKSLRYAVQDLLRAGDLQRLGDRLGFVPRPPGAPGKEEMMWRFLRLNRQAAVTKLMAVSGAARRTAVDFGERLVARGVAAKTADGFRLLEDPGPEAPFDEARADRARTWREKRRLALASLDAAFAAVAEARMAISEMED